MRVLFFILITFLALLVSAFIEALLKAAFNGQDEAVVLLILIIFLLVLCSVAYHLRKSLLLLFFKFSRTFQQRVCITFFVLSLFLIFINLLSAGDAFFDCLYSDCSSYEYDEHLLPVWLTSYFAVPSTFVSFMGILNWDKTMGRFLRLCRAFMKWVLEGNKS